MKTDADDFTYRMFAWNKPVERIDFDGRFPVSDLDYVDCDLPCKVSLRAVSPFVPHNSDASATPGFYLDFTVRNPTEDNLEISLLGALEPNFANKKEGRKNSLINMCLRAFLQLLFALSDDIIIPMQQYIYETYKRRNRYGIL